MILSTGHHLCVWILSLNLIVVNCMVPKKFLIAELPHFWNKRLGLACGWLNELYFYVPWTFDIMLLVALKFFIIYTFMSLKVSSNWIFPCYRQLGWNACFSVVLGAKCKVLPVLSSGVCWFQFFLGVTGIPLTLCNLLNCSIEIHSTTLEFGEALCSRHQLW